MKKIMIHKAGSYDQLKLESFDDLRANKDEVIVDIKAAGINYADIIIRWGYYESAKQYVGWPICPGFEYSGIVKSIGLEITDLKVGDKVVGISLFNSYATEVCVPRHQVYPLPENMSYEQAAGFPAVFMTAYHALFQHVITRAGMSALIHSAAGGVGSSLVQLCKIAKIKTIGVVGSTHKIDYLKELGCDYIIDKSQEDLWSKVKEYAPSGVDLAFDANGVSTLQESYNHLAVSGKLLAYGAHSMFPKKGGKVNLPKLVYDFLRAPRFNPLNMTSDNKSIITFNLSFLFNRQDLLSEAMNDLFKWYDEGKLVPPITTAYPLEKAGDAHRDLESGNTIGKLVLTNKPI